MSGRLAGALAAGMAALLVAAACGKKGNPLPPMRPMPGRVNDLSAHRTDSRIELQFTVPSANGEGATSAPINRVEIYRLPVSASIGVPPPTAAQLVADSKNLRAEIVVRPADSPVPSTAVAAATLPAPGEKATFVDRLDGPPPATVAAWSYVAVASMGRGRRGPPSAVVTVPLGAPPAAPQALAISYSDTQLKLAWKPAATGHLFNVFATARVVDPVSLKLLTPKPAAAAEFTMPVQFGSEQCFVVAPIVAGTGSVVDGTLSGVECVTPIDTFAPPAPANLQAIQQEGATVTLSWSAVGASDLSGYVVLRGDASGVDMRPLMREPIRDTTFSDATVQPGGTYTYSVYAVDNASTSNASQQSNRQVVTVR